MILEENKKKEIINLIKEGKLSREEIAKKFNVSPASVSAFKAHITMGTYETDEELDEIINNIEMIHKYEKDFQENLRKNIEQLEEGLKIIDNGKEIKTDAGEIDITAEDKNGNLVVIELKAVKADIKSLGQILSYMGALKDEKNKEVRGILVAPDFDKRLIYAIKNISNLKLIKYKFKYLFEEIK